MEDNSTDTAYSTDCSWAPTFLDILLNVERAATANLLTSERNHTVIRERVDIVIGIVVSILSILTVKIALAQLVALYKTHITTNRRRRQNSDDPHARASASRLQPHPHHTV